MLIDKIYRRGAQVAQCDSVLCPISSGIDLIPDGEELSPYHYQFRDHNQSITAAIYLVLGSVTLEIKHRNIDIKLISFMILVTGFDS